jgi:hypothetical protein
MSTLDTDVIKREAIPGMVEAYNTACSEVDQAFALFASARARLNAAFGHDTDFDPIYKLRYHSSPDEMKKDIRKTAWRAFLDRLEIRKFMSIKDLDKLDKQLDTNTIPEITLEALIEIQTGMINSAPEYAKKMAIEAFEILMPGTSERNPYKTNKKNARRKLGKKVILSWFVEVSCGRYMVNHYHDKQLMCVDKVFHTLDGKGVPRGYNTPLVDAINTTQVEIGKGETDYFKFWCYRNNNLHLEFKRLDLVQKLNRVAGNNSQIGD